MRAGLVYMCCHIIGLNLFEFKREKSELWFEDCVSLFLRYSSQRIGFVIAVLGSRAVDLSNNRSSLLSSVYRVHTAHIL